LQEIAYRARRCHESVLVNEVVLFSTDESRRGRAPGGRGKESRTMNMAGRRLGRKSWEIQEVGLKHIPRRIEKGFYSQGRMSN